MAADSTAAPRQAHGRRWGNQVMTKNTFEVLQLLDSEEFPTLPKREQQGTTKKTSGKAWMPRLRKGAKPLENRGVSATLEKPLEQPSEQALDNQPRDARNHRQVIGTTVSELSG